jgi:hypothetical protein
MLVVADSTPAPAVASAHVQLSRAEGVVQKHLGVADMAAAHVLDPAVRDG